MQSSGSSSGSSRTRSTAAVQSPRRLDERPRDPALTRSCDARRRFPRGERGGEEQYRTDLGDHRERHRGSEAALLPAEEALAIADGEAAKRRDRDDDAAEWGRSA